jgi:type II secretory ATPase GspE/PulE/Tfp pilus assembly ATPase PilB-like protein
MQEQMLELLALERGFVLFSAMPASGLRSTVDVTLRHTDRLTRDFMAIEEESNRYETVENVQVTTYQAGAEGAPASVLTKMFRMEPDVVVARDLVDGDMVAQLCQEIVEDRLIVSTIRAKESAEALLRVLALGVDPEELAGAVTAVLGQRLIRKLCDECKEAYAPPPQVMQQLGIPEGRIQAFYRPPEQPEEICEKCRGVGYHGRTAIFELLIAGDTVRKVLSTSPKLDLLRQAGRKDGMRTLQEEGVLLVAKGLTSLPELMRVLKQ